MYIDKEDIIESIKYQKSHISNIIRFDNDLVNTLYKILYAVFIQDKKYILLDAPTGSGKSIIGFVVSQCIHYLRDIDRQRQINNMKVSGLSEDALISFNDEYDLIKDVYYLTSSKILQDQIDKDITRFSLNSTSMLKGVANYKCKDLVDYYKSIAQGVTSLDIMLKEATYNHRPCVGCDMTNIKEKYPNCFDVCEYRLKRFETSEANVAVLNYHYAIQVLNSEGFSYFRKRFLTICDECHQVSDIVDNMFTCSLKFEDIEKLYKIIKKALQLKYNPSEESIFYSDRIEDFYNSMNNHFQITGNVRSEIIEFMKNYNMIIESSIKPGIEEILKLMDTDKNLKLKSSLSNILDRFKQIHITCDYFISVLDERPDDVYFHVYDNCIDIKDLNRSHTMKTKFLDKCSEKYLFMSATIGDFSEFVSINGLDPEDTISISLPNKFDFSTSPIYLCNAGNLRKVDYLNNIDKCIDMVLDILTKLHPNEKGVVHTHTFDINRRLIDRCYQIPELRDRILWYSDSVEKLACINKLINSESPLFIVGPSLTEGLDLKYDIGRFNILIKTPYPPINEYTRAMMNYSPYWYEHTTKQTIIQSIGRTNRMPDDRSVVYFIDSGLSRYKNSLGKCITDRIKTFDKSIIQKDDVAYDIDDIIKIKNAENINSLSYFVDEQKYSEPLDPSGTFDGFPSLDKDEDLPF